MPAAKRKVDAQLGTAVQEIEDKLVRKGPGVVRHLALPPEGKSPQWILDEMDKMDKEVGESGNWKAGWSPGKRRVCR